MDIGTKHIYVAIFTALVHQMCVLDINKLVIAYSFSFGEMFYGSPEKRAKVAPAKRYP